MSNEKTLNRAATIQKILDKCNNTIGMSIDVNKFNERIKQSDGDDFIKESAEFCGVQVVYQ